MNLIKKNLPFFTFCTVVLVAFIYLAFVNLKWPCIQLWLFLLCIIAGVAFDYIVCEWVSFLNRPKPDEKECMENSAFTSNITNHYECYDKRWNNLLLFFGFFIYGVVILLLAKIIMEKYIISTIQIPISNVVSFFGLFIPYFFHKAYYFAIRIPELKRSVYVYSYDTNEIQSRINEISQIGSEISEAMTVPREFQGWLFHTNAIFTDNENNIISNTCQIPCINQSWSYRQLLNFIFYQNNQTEDAESIYKTEWNKINLFSGNDNLVKSCWQVKINTGSASSGIPLRVEKIKDFSLNEFGDERIKVNGLLIIERVL